MINSGSKVTPRLLHNEKVPCKGAVGVRGEWARASAVLAYTHLQAEQRAWFSALVPESRLLLSGQRPSSSNPCLLRCGTPRHGDGDGPIRRQVGPITYKTLRNTAGRQTGKSFSDRKQEKKVLWGSFRPWTWPFWDLKSFLMSHLWTKQSSSLLYKALRNKVLSQNCIFSTQRNKLLQVTTKQKIASKNVLSGETQNLSHGGPWRQCLLTRLIYCGLCHLSIAMS